MSMTSPHADTPTCQVGARPDKGCQMRTARFSHQDSSWLSGRTCRRHGRKFHTWAGPQPLLAELSSAMSPPRLSSEDGVGLVKCRKCHEPRRFRLWGIGTPHRSVLWEIAARKTAVQHNRLIRKRHRDSPTESEFGNSPSRRHRAEVPAA